MLPLMPAWFYVVDIVSVSPWELPPQRLSPESNDFHNNESTIAGELWFSITIWRLKIRVCEQLDGRKKGLDLTCGFEIILIAMSKSNPLSQDRNDGGVMNKTNTMAIEWVSVNDDVISRDETDPHFGRE